MADQSAPPIADFQKSPHRLVGLLWYCSAAEVPLDWLHKTKRLATKRHPLQKLDALTNAILQYLEVPTFRSTRWSSGDLALYTR